MYGQWVEVTVLPPQPTPDPEITANTTDARRLPSMDETAFQTARKGKRHGGKRDS